ncbi:MAG: ATP-binding cassette domain-containing protein [Galbitalea sp.]
MNGVTFSVPQGEILAVIGESGSGKSTLARAVAGLAGTGGQNPVINGGSLTVLGQDARNISQRKRDRLSLRIGYVPQDAGAASIAASRWGRTSRNRSTPAIPTSTRRRWAWPSPWSSTPFAFRCRP